MSHEPRVEPPYLPVGPRKAPWLAGATLGICLIVSLGVLAFPFSRQPPATKLDGTQVKTLASAPLRLAVSKENPPAPTPKHQASLNLESLSGVREVDLASDYMSLTKVQIALKAAEISEANKNSKDAFVRSLMKERSDLAGLPFLLGEDCALDPKASRGLAATSRMVRGTLSEAMRTERRRRNPQSSGQSVDDTQGSEAAAAAEFWSSAKEWYG